MIDLPGDDYPLPLGRLDFLHYHDDFATRQKPSHSGCLSGYVLKYPPPPRNLIMPKSRKTCNCCLILGRMFLLSGCNSAKRGSYAYTSLNANSLGSASIILNTSSVQPLTLLGSEENGFALTYSSRTLLASVINPSPIIPILPATGILVSRILQPIQPALLAVGERGCLFSIADAVRKKEGMSNKFRTAQLLS
jgi:hypothetical protein